MQRALRQNDVRGYLVVEFVAYDRSLGNELLLGIRWTDDFGPVVVCSAGGVDSEFLAEAIKPGSEIAIASPYGLDADSVRELLQGVLQ